MKTKKLYDVINSKIINVPLFLLHYRDKLKIDSDSLLFIMYLSSFGKRVLFDPEKISKDLNIDYQQVMNIFSNLCELSLISLDSVKENGSVVDYISLDLFYNKVLSFIIDSDDNDASDDNSSGVTIYDKIQEEFGRTLSPIEYEIVNAWIKNNTSEELILEALKEAVFNGVNNLRYIDKILYEWGKKGYKNKSDVDKSRDKWKNKEKDNKPKKEVFDYNWLEDDQDE